MRVKDLKTKDIDKLSNILAPKLTQARLFKFLCPNEGEREEFIKAYLRYNMPHWFERHDCVLVDENLDVLVVVASPRRSSHKFKGKGAKKLRRFESAPAIFYYRGNLAYLTHLVAPRNKRLKVMTILTDGNHDEAVMELVDEAIALSYKNDFNLMYDSLTRRYNAELEEKGFVISYQKKFALTGYVETLMTLNK
ncbi:MAG: hypothetical protein IJS03_02860 [Eubacterium sp.]|nr:hypothetical protein [Eubacterium sp.]